MISTKVSVILSVKNEGRFLEEVLSDLISQTYSDKEIIVYNDGSNDNTAQVLEQFRGKVKVINNGVSLGQSYCINKAFEITDSPYLAIADGDDRYFPEKLSRQIKFLENHPEIGVCGCLFTTIPSGFHWDLPVSNSSIKARMVLNMPMAHPTLVYRRSAVKEIQYNESLMQAKDYDFLSRLRHKTGFYNLSFIGVQHRLNKANEQDRELRKNTANHIRATILNEDFSISDPEFINLHNAICNLEKDANTGQFTLWFNTLLNQNKYYNHNNLVKELHGQLWRYASKFNLNKTLRIKHLLLSGQPILQKTKALLKLLQ